MLTADGYISCQLFTFNRFSSSISVEMGRITKIQSKIYKFPYLKVVNLFSNNLPIRKSLTHLNNLTLQGVCTKHPAS